MVGILLGAMLIANVAQLAACASAQETPPADAGLAAITSDDIRAHMTFLADDLIEGRETGTRGFDIAAQYVAAQYRLLGLSVAGKSYFQPVPLRKGVIAGNETTFVLGGEPLVYGTEVLTYGHPSAPMVNVAAPVVDVGFGITSPEQKYDDDDGKNVSGRIALVSLGAPENFPAGVREYYRSVEVKQQNAVAHGAIGMLFIDGPAIPWEARVNATQQIGTMEWLPSRHPEQLKVVAYVNATAREKVRRLAAQAAVATAHIRTQHRELSSSNVVGIIRGADPSLRREYIVYTAHLDHGGIQGTGEDRIYNGAVDNASGVAALLGIAKAFRALPAPPLRSILFVATTGEEPGLIGADYFVHHQPIEDGGRIVAAINIDGASLMLFPLLDVVAMGGENSSLGQIVEWAGERLGIKTAMEPMPLGGSDPFPFVKRGIPAVWLRAGNQTTGSEVDGVQLTGEWMRSRFHSPKDDLSQSLDYGAAAKHAAINFMIGYVVASRPDAPRWNDGDELAVRSW